MSELGRIQDLYDCHRYLQAFRETAAYWNPATGLDRLSTGQLVLGGRLASRLGGLRLARHLLLTAHARDPNNPTVRYFTFTLRVGRRGLHLFDLLRAFEDHPDLEEGDPELQASWLAQHAVLWASLLDFGRAADCIERARSFAPEDPWVLSCGSEVLQLAHRWEEALKTAERAWEISPGAPYAARCLGQSLVTLGRVEESAERLVIAAEKGESYEVSVLACWHLCALADTLDGEMRRKALDRAGALAETFSILAPLADREARSIFARIRLDIAEQYGDHEAMQRWAEEIRSPFHRRILENLRKNPQRDRIRLPFRRVPQKQDTCLPASLSSVLAGMGVPIGADEIASEITHGGTPYWAAAEWLEKRGLVVRFFTVTPQVATGLLHSGIPFILGLESESTSHAVAVVGIDESAETLLIYDPSSFRTCEYLGREIGENETPLGPKGMAMVLPERAELLDFHIPSEDAEAMTAYHRHQRATEMEGPGAAGRVIEELAERHPLHPITRYLQGIRLKDGGHAGEALESFQQLLNEFPNCLAFRLGLLSACRSLGNTALMRDTLASVVDRGTLPGVQSGQDWRYPPATYVCQYADYLRLSAVSRRESRLMLRSVIRQQHAYAEAWHVLGDLLWYDRDTDGMLLSYRIASCIEDYNEHYAVAYSDALRNAGREEEGLTWLETRAGKSGSSPRAVEPWVSWIGSLEDYGHPERALAACDKALERYGGSPMLLDFAVTFFARMGDWKRSETSLRRLEEAGHTPLYYEGAVAFQHMSGNLEIATELSKEWVGESPLSMVARRRCLDLITQHQGRRAGVDLSSQWTAENPGHDELEELHYYQLKGIASDREQDVLLLRRVRRNPEDGWAWRELTSRFLEKYECSRRRRREALQPHIERFLDQCERTAPENPATLRVKAFWYEVRGQWSSAVEIWIKAIDEEPGNFYGYRRVWDCSAGLDEAERRRIHRRIEPVLLQSVGRLVIARDMIFLLAQRFGIAAAEEAATGWKERRPDDPDVIAAAADLLLEYGHGRSDAGRALATLEPAVHRFPYHVGLRFSLARACRVLQKEAEAEDVLREIIRRHPDKSAAYIQLAWIHERRGDSETAQSLLRSAAGADPLDPEVWCAKVEMKIRRGCYADACATIDEGLQRMPESIQWREMAVKLFFDCADEERAVEAAREGIRFHPRGAYLWYLLAETLNRTRHSATPIEIESCLRRALSLNASLFYAADGLAVFLAGQHRYDEAEEVIQQIIPHMADPSFARGRLSWLHRERGQRDEALEEMVAAVRAAPWYRWGWDRLLDWLSEEKQWDRARSLLCPAPPELRTYTQFRRRRLLLLAASGIPATELDAEWDELLRDFPEDVPLHLERYDDLRGHKRVPEAVSVLNTIRAADPENPYVLGRLVRVLAEENKKDEAIDVLLRVFFADMEQSSWPADHAWQAAQDAHFEDEAYERIRQRLSTGARPMLHAFSIMATHAMQRESIRKRIPQPLWRAWFPGTGAREVMALLDLVDRMSWADGRYRTILFERLGERGYYRLVIRYWKKNRAVVEADVNSWSQVGCTLINLGRKKEARKLLASWRTHPGVGMWTVANYTLCSPRRRHNECPEIFSACRDALAGLSHDHCAKYLAHVLAEVCALLGDMEGFREAWTKYRGYFVGEVVEGDWFEGRRLYLLRYIPRLAELLEKNQMVAFRKLCRHMRKGKPSPSI